MVPQAHFPFFEAKQIPYKIYFEVGLFSPRNFVTLEYVNIRYMHLAAAAAALNTGEEALKAVSNLYGHTTHLLSQLALYS